MCSAFSVSSVSNRMTPMNRWGLGVACLVGISVASVASQDHIAALGITQTRAKEAIFDSFMANTLSLAGKAEVFKAASPQMRATMVTAIATMGKAFVESADFKQRYSDHREANGPDPLPPEQTVDQIYKKQRDDYEKQVEGIRAMYDEITPEQRKTLEAGFVEMRAKFDEIEKEGRADLEASLRSQRGPLVAAHDAATKEFEKVFPSDPKLLVANRLRAFLEVSRDVNFNAQLTDKNGKKVFADPALEAKPAEWKMLFRAGKPATDAARAFAQKWLAELEGKG